MVSNLVFALFCISLCASVGALDGWIKTTTYSDSGCTTPIALHSCSESTTHVPCDVLPGTSNYYNHSTICTPEYSVPLPFNSYVSLFNQPNCSDADASGMARLHFPGHHGEGGGGYFGVGPYTFNYYIAFYTDTGVVVKRAAFNCNEDGLFTYSLCEKRQCASGAVPFVYGEVLCNNTNDALAVSINHNACGIDYFAPKAPVAEPVDAPVSAPVSVPLTTSPSAAPVSASPSAVPQSAPVTTPVKSNSGIAVGAHWHVLALAALFIAQL